MQAIILAAGMGKRLQHLTKDNTKCMVPVNGVPLIERMLNILDKKNLSKIVMVVGYQSDNLIEHIQKISITTPIEYVFNSIYDKTNNIYSLALAKEYLIGEDTLLFESDLIFEEKLVDMLLEDKRESLALVDKWQSWMDGSCVVVDERDSITDFISGKHVQFSCTDNYYKTVNIYKFSKEFSKNIYVPFLEAYEKVMGNSEYYESVIKLILMLEKNTLKAKRLQGERWYEIDDIQDLDIASSLFAENLENQYQQYMSRYGGYWRYPAMLDFCYLTNPYFPPERLKEEIKAEFGTLLTAYPSGMRVNSLLAAKNFNVDMDHIVIGNGAAELIKEVLYLLEGEIGIVCPTFEEYPHRCEERCVFYNVAQNDFEYRIEDIENYFKEKSIRILVIINPDNPTGHAFSTEECKALLEWCETKGIKLILDESFVDFTSKTASFLTEEWLRKYKNLFVIKSISKSYGVAGIRLGVLASSDREIIQRLKKQVSIWNINSFAEFYMQIFGKYQKEYIESLERFQNTKQEFQKKLEAITWLRVFPSEANYFMCEVLDGKTSQELCVQLLEKNILIKDLTAKIGNGRQYIRVAVRSDKENIYLIEMLLDLTK